jgi:hypothetical protein
MRRSIGDERFSRYPHPVKEDGGEVSGNPSGKIK